MAKVLTDLNPSNVRDRQKCVGSTLEPKNYITIKIIQRRIDAKRSNDDENTKTLFAKTRWTKLLITN